MHPYSITDIRNINERKLVLWKLAFFTSIIFVGIGSLIIQLSSWNPLFTLITPPSTLVIYLFLLNVIDNYLWKQSLVKLILGISTPDINGEWRGVLRGKRYDNTLFANATVKLIIEQNWTTMGISFETDRTKSSTKTSSIIREAGEVKVYYHYYAEKKRPDDDFENHLGSGELRIKIKNEKLDPESMEVYFFTQNLQKGQGIFTQDQDKDLSLLKDAITRNVENREEIQWVD